VFNLKKEVIKWAIKARKIGKRAKSKKQLRSLTELKKLKRNRKKIGKTLYYDGSHNGVLGT